MGGIPTYASASSSARCSRGLPDARISLCLVLAYSVSLFCVEGWIGLLMLAVALLAFGFAIRPDIRKIAVGLVPLYVLLAFTVVAHFPQGLTVGLFYASRILLLAFATLMVSFGYDDSQLVRAFASLLSPLRAVRAPVDDVATMFSIALRFIPTSLDEIRRVHTAQLSRGARFDEGGIVDRVRCWSMVLVPVIVGMFRRAESLACAMDARCYTGERRTSLHSDALSLGDAALFVIGVAVCMASAVFA